jgi:hypothetical protein
VTDDDVLLRCVSEGCDRLISDGALADYQAVPPGDWCDAVQRLLDELRRFRLQHASTREMQSLLAEAIAAKLVLARGDRSVVAIERGNAAEAAANSQWRVLTEMAARET